MASALGKHWILLRGLARESAHWGDFVPQLQAAFPQAKITTLDLAGTGCYFREASPRTIHGIAETLRNNAYELGLLDQPVTVLALSLGGMVAWDWMQHHPADINGAVLLSTSFGGLNFFYERLRWQCYGKFFALVKEHDIRKRELAVLELLNNNRNLDAKLANEWVSIQQQRPVSPKNLLNQILAAAMYRPGAAKPSQPVLLLNSSGDRLVAPCCSETIQKKWNLELHTHPWAGHDLTTDNGEWVVAQLKCWLGSTINP